jgi:hypothetical protein
MEEMIFQVIWHGYNFLVDALYVIGTVVVVSIVALLTGD